MATVKIEVTAGAQTVTESRTVTTAHLTRFIDAYKAKATRGPGPGAPPVTDAEVINRWANDVFRDARSIVLFEEQLVANSSVTPIEFS